jgi:RHH-type proline utilization regulon transcriptional repressor/proline dehydrogenase/delta 1-pyrroline-5-carboxylate dehydrogenase
MNTLDQRILHLGSELLERARAAEPRPYQLDYWAQRAMNWSVERPWLKNRMFRFVEVLPALRRDEDIAAHLKMYLQPNGKTLPAPLGWALAYRDPRSSLASWVARTVRQGSEFMARKFVAGANADEAIATIKQLRAGRQAFTIDLLGEAITSETQAEQVTETYLRLIRDLGTAARQWPRQSPIDYQSSGPYPIVNISVKLTALYSQFSPMAPQRTTEIVSERLTRILRAARRYDAFVNVDVEQYCYKNLTFEIFKRVLEQPEFRDYPDAGIVIQAYLRDSIDELQRLVAWNRRREAPLAVRLVKGAYWDYESSLAGHATPPVFMRKWQSDENFEACAAILFENVNHIRPAFGTHNVRSIASAIAMAERAGVDVRDFELQMLYGMGEPLKKAVAGMGYFLRIYTPYGTLVPGMAYLIRRLLENTANESFLRQSFSEHQPPETLLANPARHADNGAAAGPPVARSSQEKTMSAFKNEPFNDFSNAEIREKMIGAIRDVRADLGKSHPLVINGRRVETSEWITSVNPSDTAEIIGRVGKATIDHADQAIAAARAALPAWRARSAAERADVLRKCSAIMRQRRFALDAMLVLEAGKTWLEADADVAEAIDFCDYYAEEIEQMCNSIRARNIPGETNTYFYEPRGVTLVVAPWNFPLAILCGMTTAAMVTGNTVIMKPATFTPVIAAQFMDVLEEAGMPAGVVNFLPGPGSTVGDHIVRHKEVNMIVFTGSREVGLGMIRAAADFPDGQNFIKKVVAELGGKNAMIVDSDADLDAAVQGAVAAAFGYTGQKCSACSRAIVLEDVYDAFVEKFAEAAKSIHISAPEDPGAFTGPVIDESARKTILGYIEKGRTEGRVVVDTDVTELASKGYFVGPLIVADVDRNATIAQEEIFGPVVAVIKAKDFDDALDIANGTSYALTGGMYSRNPEHLKRIQRELEVGNMYLNRKITGALVDRQPFGGFKMSGIGSKAGGPDYLIQFVEPRSVTENTLRTGLAEE